MTVAFVNIRQVFRPTNHEFDPALVTISYALQTNYLV